jgi:hypothetical protein
MHLDKEAGRIGDGRGLSADIRGLRAGENGGDVERRRSDNIDEAEDDFLLMLLST